MKKILFIIIVATITCNFFANAQIDLNTVVGNENLQKVTENVPNDTKTFLEDLGIDNASPESLLSLSFADFLKFLWEQFKDSATSPIKHAFLIMAICVMCALLENFKTSIESESLNRVFSTCATLGVVGIISEGTIDCIIKTCESVNTYNTFMLSYIPIYGATIATTGSVYLSGAFTGWMLMVCEIISVLIVNTILPLMNIYFALSIVAGINPSLNLSTFVSGFKKTVIWVLTLLMTVFTGFMSIQTVIASGKDNLTIKTGKYLLGSFVPIVGSALSEVYLSVQSCLKLLKNSVGSYAIIATIVTCLPVLINLVVWKISMHLWRKQLISFANIFRDFKHKKCNNSRKIGWQRVFNLNCGCACFCGYYNFFNMHNYFGFRGWVKDWKL